MMSAQELIDDDDVLIDDQSSRVIPSDSNSCCSSVATEKSCEERGKRKSSDNSMCTLIDLKKDYYDQKLKAYENFNEKRIQLLAQVLQRPSSAVPEKKLKSSMAEDLELDRPVELLDSSNEVESSIQENAGQNKSNDLSDSSNKVELSMQENAGQSNDLIDLPSEVELSTQENVQQNKSVELLDLPNEVILDNILGLLNLADRSTLRLTCKHLYDLCNADQICKNEKIIWSENMNDVKVESTLIDIGRRYFNLVINNVQLQESPIKPFFEVHGSKVRSLTIKRWHFSPGILEHLILCCEGLRSLTLSFHSKEAVSEYFTLEPDIVTRSTVTYLNLTLPRHQPYNYFHRMFAIFPNVKHLKIKSVVKTYSRYSPVEQKLIEECSAIFDELMKKGKKLKSLKLQVPLRGLLPKKSKFFALLPDLQDLCVHCDDDSYVLRGLFRCFLNVDSLEIVCSGYLSLTHMICLLSNPRLNHLTLISASSLYLNEESFQVFVLSQLKIVHLLASEISSLPLGFSSLPLEANKTVTDLYLSPRMKCPESTALAFSKYFCGLVSLSVPTLTDNILQNIFQFQENLLSLELGNCMQCSAEGFCGGGDRNFIYSINNLQKLEHLKIGHVSLEIIESESFKSSFNLLNLQYLRIEGAWCVRDVGPKRYARISPVIYENLCRLRAVRFGDIAMPSRETLVKLFENRKNLNYLRFDMNSRLGTSIVTYINSQLSFIKDTKYNDACIGGHVFFDKHLDRWVILNEALGRKLCSPMISSYEVEWIET